VASPCTDFPNKSNIVKGKLRPGKCCGDELQKTECCTGVAVLHLGDPQPYMMLAMTDGCCFTSVQWPHQSDAPPTTTSHFCFCMMYQVGCNVFLSSYFGLTWTYLCRSNSSFIIDTHTLFLYMWDPEIVFVVCPVSFFSNPTQHMHFDCANVGLHCRF
jgi:hypothetical protein